MRQHLLAMMIAATALLGPAEDATAESQPRRLREKMGNDERGGPGGQRRVQPDRAGENHSWPSVSKGDNYDGSAIPRHSTNPAFTRPLVSWTPVIAPGGMIQYRGTLFSGWTGDFILAGLVQQGIVRVRVSGNTAAEAARIGLGTRIREVEEGPDGSIWVLQDGDSGKLVRLRPQG